MKAEIDAILTVAGVTCPDDRSALRCDIFAALMRHFRVEEVYYVDASEAIGRQEEIFGPDERIRIYIDRSVAEDAAGEVANEYALATGGDTISTYVRETTIVPDWAEDLDVRACISTQS